MNDDWINIAKEFATEIHIDQKRKFNKEPYINHPRRVSERCKDKISKCIAWLHDTVEDADNPEKALQHIKDTFPTAVVNGVIALTRTKDKDYAQYIIELLTQPATVLAVKLADLMDNMSDLKDGSNLKVRYKLSHHIISNEIIDKANLWTLIYTEKDIENGKK